MVDYEMFKGMVEEKFKNYLPEEYRDAKLELCRVNKINQCRDVISISFDTENAQTFPNVYIDEMYKYYGECGDIEKTMRDIAGSYAGYIVENDLIDFQKKFPDIKDNLVFMLVNTAQNVEMLKNVPHREFQDLSIIYRWIVDIGENGISSSIINNKTAEISGLTEEMMYKLAEENTKRLLPVYVENVSMLMREMFVNDGMPAEMVEMLNKDINNNIDLWVVSNGMGVNGAVSILYEEKLNELAEKIGSDLFIIPSSIHEVLVTSDSVCKPEELAEMVKDINFSTVPLSDRLSNQIYHYDRTQRKISLATDTPNKRLDGMVAEKPPVYLGKDVPR